MSKNRIVKFEPNEWDSYEDNDEIPATKGDFQLVHRAVASTFKEVDRAIGALDSRSNLQADAIYILSDKLNGLIKLTAVLTQSVKQLDKLLIQQGELIGLLVQRVFPEAK